DALPPPGDPGRDLRPRRDRRVARDDRAREADRPRARRPREARSPRRDRDLGARAEGVAGGAARRDPLSATPRPWFFSAPEAPLGPGLFSVIVQVGLPDGGPSTSAPAVA